jgi:hypothetical protein
MNAVIMKLLPTEKSLPKFNHIAIEMLVRVTPDKLKDYLRGGVSAQYVHAFSGIGVVQQIIVNERHGWNSVEVRFEKTTQWFPVEDLEPCARPKRAAKPKPRSV